MATNPTSYSSQGAQAPPKPDVEFGSARTSVLREVVPELIGARQEILAYERMLRSDVAPSVSLRACRAPVLGADFYIESFSDNQDDLDVAEFVEANLFSLMTTPFDNVKEDALECIQYGYSVLSPVWTIGEWAPKRSGANRKRYNLLRKITLRPTPTIKKIIYDDNGGPVEILQNAIRADNSIEEVTIPIANAMIFTFQRQGGNLEGKSVLRSAYSHWKYKSGLYKIDAIQKERHGIGIPKVKLPQGYTTADKIAAHELGRNLRTNEWAHMVLPPGLDVEFAELHGNAVDVIPSIEHHNAMIMLNVLLEFLLSGVDAGGGRATSATQIDMFLKASVNLGKMVCGIFNQFLIPQLVAYNFKVAGMPKLKARNIGQTKDLQQFAAAMGNLANGKNPVLTMDEETENWVRSLIDAPRFHGKRPVPQQTPQPDSQNGTANGKAKGTVDQKIKPGNTGAG